MKHVVTTPETVQYEWLTDWMLALGLDTVKGVLKNLATTNNFESRLALQTALVRPDNPSAPSLLESSYLVGATGRCTGALDVSSATEGAMFARLGVAYRQVSANVVPEQADGSSPLSMKIFPEIAACVPPSDPSAPAPALVPLLASVFWGLSASSGRSGREPGPRSGA